MTSSLFATPHESTSIEDRISAYAPIINPAFIPATIDRWLLASNLQKAIRRGHRDVAVGTTIKLLAVDAKYFWRRLLVIGYEDVGFGEIELLHALLKTFRREALHRKLGVERVAAYFAHELASALKSRSLCDAIAMVEFNVRRGALEHGAALMTEAQFLDVICSNEEPLVNRISCLRHICGYREQAHGRYRTLAPTQPTLMREVCRRLEVTDMEATLFLSGQSISESLNIPIPIVSKLMRWKPIEVQEAPISFEGKNGILYSALDRHTRAGKKSFSRFAREAEGVADFFRCHPQLDPVTALGVAVFIVEGARLNRWVSFPGAANLRETFEAVFLEHCGVTGGGASELLGIVSENLTELNRIRAESHDE